MGRMLDALKRAERASGEAEERLTATPSIGIPSPTEPPSEDEEEIPFIEVGPRKSMEASPSVLACSPIVPLSPLIGALPTLAAPASRQVQFRALPTFRATIVPIRGGISRLSRTRADGSRAGRRSGCGSQGLRAEPGNPGFAVHRLPAGHREHDHGSEPGHHGAREGLRRVLVVDAHLRQPAVAERLGLSASPGLREVLAGSIALERALQPTEQPNLFALTAGTSNPQSALRTPQAENGPRFVGQTLPSPLPSAGAAPRVRRWTASGGTTGRDDARRRLRHAVFGAAGAGSGDAANRCLVTTHLRGGRPSRRLYLGCRPGSFSLKGSPNRSLRGKGGSSSRSVLLQTRQWRSHRSCTSIPILLIGCAGVWAESCLSTTPFTVSIYPSCTYSRLCSIRQRGTPICSLPTCRMFFAICLGCKTGETRIASTQPRRQGWRTTQKVPKV